MAFVDPDTSFRQQADRLQRLQESFWDLAMSLSSNEKDARRVNLMNVIGAISHSQSILRICGFVKEGGEKVMAEGLGINPIYINEWGKDLMRGGRLHMLVESQFQLEALFANVLIAAALPHRDSFYAKAKELLKFAGAADQDVKLKLLQVPAWMRNSMHNNGIHNGYEGSSDTFTIDGFEFEFGHGKPVRCGGIIHIVTALASSQRIVAEMLRSSPVAAIGFVADSYTEATS